MGNFVKVGVKQDFPENRTTGITVQGHTFTLARWAGGFYAFDEHCTHAAAPLTDLDIEDGEITCPLHGAKFSVMTGSPVALPATKPVKMVPVKIEGENLYLEIV